MKVGLVVPSDTPPTGGNMISAQRLQSGLQKLGITAVVERFRPQLPAYDVYHAWNAVQVGQALLREGVEPERIVITWTGTDLWGDWIRDSQPIRRTLQVVKQQVVFTPNARLRLLQDAPDWEDIVHVIPPSVDDAIFSPEKTPVNPTDSPLVVIAGGVRPVKRSAWAIDLVDRARRVLGMDLRLAMLGPVRDPGEWERVVQGAEGRSWVELVGEVPKEAMADWYRRASVVLNTSQIEGVSNALMEAMACGALIVATNIHGNRYLIDSHKTGILFDDEGDFIREMQWIFSHPAESNILRHNARMRILSQHLLIQEAEAYHALYDVAMNSCPKGCGI
ncbi:MAG: glycosyltransferase [Sulfobacillus thermotolerans]|uniref:Glycosyl transferase family 1 domain-containing protein n=1 Tax=Sulfobacillus thermotolerans TaxID=338644 RepID=A0ABM6RPP5_9FIRM|nr:hypothetical protein BXT84_04290 [Sulfobacillus thermotolerans]MCY0906920.1 glycosyltransferase [Sulfobacillus thermotolerans]